MISVVTRSVHTEGVFAFIKLLANVTLVRRPLVIIQILGSEIGELQIFLVFEGEVPATFFILFSQIKDRPVPTLSM